MTEKKQGFISKLIDRIDQNLEKKAKEKKCSCQSNKCGEQKK